MSKYDTYFLMKETDVPDYVQTRYPGHFAPDAALAARLPDALVAGRGVVPFARLGEWALVALLSPHDADLRRRVGEALGMEVRFYLADPSAVEAAVERLHPADTKA